jgi:hypothetical protein
LGLASRATSLSKISARPLKRANRQPTTISSFCRRVSSSLVAINRYPFAQPCAAKARAFGLFAQTLIAIIQTISQRIFIRCLTLSLISFISLNAVFAISIFTFILLFEFIIAFVFPSINAFASIFIVIFLFI